MIPKEVDLYDVQDSMMKQFSPIANQKDIQFSVQLEPDGPQHVYTDEQRLQQILKNLLSNAFKFTESGSVSLASSKGMKEKIMNKC